MQVIRIRGCFLVFLVGQVCAFPSSTFTSLASPPRAEIANALKSKLFPYQEEGSDRLVQVKRLLLADEMGLGKTVQCIAAINKLHQRQRDKNAPMMESKQMSILIICPKSVLGVWETELHTWLDIGNNTNLEVQITTPKAFAYPTPATAVCGDGSDGGFMTIMMINYDLCHKFREELREVDYDIVICDEAHYLKSRDAKRTVAILGSDQKKKKDTGIVPSPIPSEYLWLLTGTPILNRPVELYTLLRAIQPSEFDSFERYANRYCNPKKIRDRRGNYRIDYSGSMNLTELAGRLKPIMLRRYKEDVLTQLPPKFRSYKILIDNVTLVGSRSSLGSAAMVERERLREMIGSRLEKFGSEESESDMLKYVMPRVFARNIDMDDPDSTRDIMGIISSIRKETALRKVQPAIELLNEVIEAKSKVVVFAHHREVIHALLEKFGRHAVCVMGGMDVHARNEAVHRFQHDSHVHLFVGSIRAAGVGLTLTASSRVVFLELDWSPGVMSQAEDRCHRVGSESSSVQIQYYVFKDTIDEWIAKTLLTKQNNIDEIMGAGDGTLKTGMVQSGYILDFGKHAGLRLEDVPGSYLAFLLRVKAWKSRPKLWETLYKKGMVSSKPPHIEETSETGRMTERNTIQGSLEEKETRHDTGYTILSHLQPESMADYIFDFGKYKGCRWNDAPPSYRQWIVKEGVWKNRALLKSSLVKAGILMVENNHQDKVLEPTLIPQQVGPRTFAKANNHSKTGTPTSSNNKFPIKSFRLKVQCPYLIEELKARNILFQDEDRNKINRLKKRLLDWYEQESPDSSNRTTEDAGAKTKTQEIEIIGCNIEDLWTVTKTKKPLPKK